MLPSEWAILEDPFGAFTFPRHFLGNHQLVFLDPFTEPIVRFLLIFI